MNPDTGFPLAFVEVSEMLGRYDLTETHAERLAELFPTDRYPMVLDMCCGIGRFAGAMQRRGYEVTAIDLSAEQIAMASAKHPGPDYRVGNMMTPPDGPFDLILNMYTSFGYLETPDKDGAALAAWARVLRPGGVLVMELADMERARARLNPGGDVIRRRTGPVVEELRMNWAASHLRVTYDYDGQRFTLDTRLYEKEQLAEMLRAAGFAEIYLYGDLDGRPKRPEDNLFVIARTPEAEEVS